jgi:glycine cleavage system H protein
MKLPQDLKYTKEHEWLRVEGNVGTIGITQFAQGELGDIVFIEMEPVGSAIATGEKFGSIEAVKTVSDMFAPCDGTILEINDALNSSPEVVNQDPYGSGWMVKIELSDPAQANSLLDSAAYAELIGQ